MQKTINLIVACSENRVMGRDGKLPWRIAEDSRFFNDQTAGHVMVLGRICFETWPRATRDGRRAVVITRDHSLAREGVWVAPSLADALRIADSLPGEIYVAGGERIFEESLALKRPLRLHLTLIHAEVAGDRFFPEWRHLPWRMIDSRESRDGTFRFTFSTWELGDWASERPLRITGS